MALQIQEKEEARARCRAEEEVCGWVWMCVDVLGLVGLVGRSCVCLR